MKHDNERILELNQILLDKIHNKEKDKRNDYEIDSEKISYKNKGKKIKFHDSESSLGVNIRLHRDMYKYTSESSESNHKPRKIKYKPYEEISREFRKINPPMFNGEVEKGEEATAWFPGMKKYFQIYNYSDRLKSRMAIYNLIEKADIWWKDIKRVKNIKEKYLTWRIFKTYFKSKFLS